MANFAAAEDVESVVRTKVLSVALPDEARRRLTVCRAGHIARLPCPYVFLLFVTVRESRLV